MSPHLKTDPVPNQSVIALKTGFISIVNPKFYLPGSGLGCNKPVKIERRIFAGLEKAPSPIEAIKFRMEQMNLKQADLAPIFGGKTRVSEVFNGRRALTLKMITLLNRYLGIPLESLISGNKEVKLEPENREKLLHVSSIKEYLNNRRAAVI